MSVRLRPMWRRTGQPSELEQPSEPSPPLEPASEPETTGIVPDVCPECHGPGILDHIHLTRQTKTQTCGTCRHRWESYV